MNATVTIRDYTVFDHSSLVVDGRDRYLPFMNGRGHERLGTNGQKCIRKFHVMVTVKYIKRYHMESKREVFTY